MTNVISMWCAQNLPMTCSLKQVNATALQLLANLCAGMILRGIYDNNEHTLQHVLQVMITACVIYDRTTHEGVFNPNSPVKVTHLHYSTC